MSSLYKHQKISRCKEILPLRPSMKNIFKSGPRAKKSAHPYIIGLARNEMVPFFDTNYDVFGINFKKATIDKSFRSYRQPRVGPVGQWVPLAQSSTSRRTLNPQKQQELHRQQQHQQQQVALLRLPLLLLPLHLQSQQHRLDIKIYHHPIVKVNWLSAYTCWLFL